MIGSGLEPRRRETARVVSALFDSTNVVDEALRRLYVVGLPRDLIEVVVSREGSERFYGGRAKAPGRQVLRYTGLGALIGLLAGSGISLLMVAIPGLDAPAGLAIVQLLGPNFGSVAGAVVGAGIGAFVRAKPKARHARVLQSEPAILVTVRGLAEEQAIPVAELLRERGGRDVLIE